MARLAFRDGERSFVTREELRVELLLLMRRLGQLVRTPPLLRSSGSVRPVGGPPPQEDPIERLCLSVGLGMPWDAPPGRARRINRGEGSLGFHH